MNATNQATAEQAARTLDALADIFCRGERDYLGHALECGRLCHEYVLQRRALGHGRAAAVQAIAGKLSETAGSAIEPNRYIAAFWVSRLLGEGTDYSAMTFSVLVAHNPLLKRNSQDESWNIRAGLEEQGRALFRKAAELRIDRDGVAEAVRLLRGKQPRDGGNDEPPDGTPGHDAVARALPAVARKASPQDLAGCLADAVAGSPDPAAVLQHLGRRLGWQPDWAKALAMGLRAGGHAKAANALLLVLKQWQRREHSAA